MKNLQNIKFKPAKTIVYLIALSLLAKKFTKPFLLELTLASKSLKSAFYSAGCLMILFMSAWLMALALLTTTFYYISGNLLFSLTLILIFNLLLILYVKYKINRTLKNISFTHTKNYIFYKKILNSFHFL